MSVHRDDERDILLQSLMEHDFENDEIKLCLKMENY